MTARRERRRLRAILLGTGLFLFLLLMSTRPDISGLALLALMVASLVAGICYEGLEAFRALRRRTRLAIAGIMSDGRPRDRNEIAREVGRWIPALRYPPLRWLRLHDQGLADMAREGLLARHDDKYFSTRPHDMTSRS